VLGAGVVGVTTAYYLSRSGHQVSVLDRKGGPALETSFANAGEISPGYASPWASPGLPTKAMKWLFMRHGPLVIHPRFDPAMWRWVFSTLRNCNAASYAINKLRMVRLAEYSRDQLRALRSETNLQYDQRSQGTLQLFRSQKQLDQVGADLAVLDEHRVPYELLDSRGCVRVEPALARVADRIAGGLRLPEDETGDCYKFTTALAAMAGTLGATFEYETHVRELLHDSDRITGVVSNEGTRTADAYVIALGSYSPLLLRNIGVSIPVYPIKGYSITLPITDPSGAPDSTVMDETYKVAITRLGQRIRVGGTAEIAGYNTRLSAGRRLTLEHSVRTLFPGGADFRQNEFWTGLRPMTPDGTPTIGATRYRNLYLNTGHGTLGWTMACGSGKVLADLMSNRAPDIEIGDLAISRYAASRGARVREDLLAGTGS
jgi:D-amino-acid dehydrogenase